MKTPEKIKKRNAAWNKLHPDVAKAATDKWRKKNQEKVKATYAAWKKANAKRVKKAKSEWDKANPKAYRRYWHNRRAQKISNGGKLSPGLEAKLLAFQKNRCAICRASLKKTGYHLDHIIPLSRGGKNIDSNTQITCPTCNLEKNSKDPIQFMREKGFLL
jgi:5-methylcytosine-specific restriction endonuclease McrA